MFTVQREPQRCDEVRSYATAPTNRFAMFELCLRRMDMFRAVPTMYGTGLARSDSVAARWCFLSGGWYAN